MVKAIGIDFGTTNSVVALLHEDGSVTTRRHATLDVFRSVLCFWTEPLPGRTLLHHAAGPEAITAYLEDPQDSRLIMSMKTYLSCSDLDNPAPLANTVIARAAKQSPA